MSNTNNGGPAFPFTEHNHDGSVYHQHLGMTLRDYFAAKAMQVDYKLASNFSDPEWRVGVAHDAYKMADAMLKARELQGEEAAKAISEFAGLELVPIPEDQQREALRRARMGFRDPAWGWLP